MEFAPPFQKTGEEIYLNRKVERWKSSIEMDGRTLTIEYFVDRELRAILQTIYNENIASRAVKIEIGALSEDIFGLADDYTLF